ncbi:MAG: YIP1 family protein [Pseudomonadota bacterium]
MPGYFTRFVLRCVALIRQPRATLIEFGGRPPPWPIPLREHLLLLIAMQTPTVVLLLAPADASLTTYLFFGILVVVALTLQAFISTGVLFLLCRLLGGRGTFDSGFVLYVMSATPGALISFLSLVLTLLIHPTAQIGFLAPLVTLISLGHGLLGIAALIFSFVLIYIGAEVVLQVPKRNQVIFIGLWIFIVVVITLLMLESIPSAGITLG